MTISLSRKSLAVQTIPYFLKVFYHHVIIILFKVDKENLERDMILPEGAAYLGISTGKTTAEGKFFIEHLNV